MSNQPEIRSSADGSATVYSPRFDALYHSHHGALQETQHVFVDAGFRFASQHLSTVDVLELGFGTGLNAAATWVLAKAKREAGIAANPSIRYVGIEAFPLPQNLLAAFRSGNESVDAALAEIHKPAWPSVTGLDAKFLLEKRLTLIESLGTDETFDCIYHDAFAPQTQPELWSQALFERLYTCTRGGGVLVTYCAQGQVRRNMRSAGWTVEKLPGPPGKREMTRALRG